MSKKKKGKFNKNTHTQTHNCIAAFSRRIYTFMVLFDESDDGCGVRLVVWRCFGFAAGKEARAIFYAMLCYNMLQYAIRRIKKFFFLFFFFYAKIFYCQKKKIKETLFYLKFRIYTLLSSLIFCSCHFIWFFRFSSRINFFFGYCSASDIFPFLPRSFVNKRYTRRSTNIKI